MSVVVSRKNPGNLLHASSVSVGSAERKRESEGTTSSILLDNPARMMMRRQAPVRNARTELN